MNDTPETDAAWKEGNAIREWTCRKLERERDDLQKAINGLCEHFELSPANTTLLAVELLKIERERDEARDILRLYRQQIVMESSWSATFTSKGGC